MMMTMKIRATKNNKCIRGVRVFPMLLVVWIGSLLSLREDRGIVAAAAAAAASSTTASSSPPPPSSSPKATRRSGASRARERILGGYWTLVSLDIPRGGLQRHGAAPAGGATGASPEDGDDAPPPSALLPNRGGGDGPNELRYNVRATFCEIDWSLHQKDPSRFSFFADLRDGSSLCQMPPSSPSANGNANHDENGHYYTTDLYELMTEIREYDLLHDNHAVDNNEDEGDEDDDDFQDVLQDNDVDDGADRSNATKRRRRRRRRTVDVRAAPDGVVFHESRCGSTLAANMLASFDPRRTRVYSEHFAPMDALRACPHGAGGSRSGASTSAHDSSSSSSTDSTGMRRREEPEDAAAVACDADTHMRLIRDVYYVLGRTPRSHGIRRVYYKTNSGGMYIDQFASAFPAVPWVYMYRDTYEILRSHFREVPERAVAASPTAIDDRKNGPHAPTFLDQESYVVSAATTAAAAAPSPTTDVDIPCARNHKNPHQPPTTLQVLTEAWNRSREGDGRNHRTSATPTSATNRTGAFPAHDRLTRTEYCAAHLASISKAVLREHERTGRGRFVNYRDMPSAVWDAILPAFGVGGADARRRGEDEITPEMRQRMERVSKIYSKGGKQRLKQQQQHNQGHQHSASMTPIDAAMANGTMQQGRRMEPTLSDALQEIRDAIRRFSPNTYEQLESAAARQRSCRRDGPHQQNQREQPEECIPDAAATTVASVATDLLDQLVSVVTG